MCTVAAIHYIVAVLDLNVDYIPSEEQMEVIMQSSVNMYTSLRKTISEAMLQQFEVCYHTNFPRDLKFREWYGINADYLDEALRNDCILLSEVSTKFCQPDTAIALTANAHTVAIVNVTNGNVFVFDPMIAAVKNCSKQELEEFLSLICSKNSEFYLTTFEKK